MHWTTYLTALLTPTLAIFGLIFAYRQWLVARNKLKLDLFDRRLAVYEAARDFSAAMISGQKNKDEEAFKFLIVTRTAKWLFNVSVADYLENQLYSNALELQSLISQLDGMAPGDERIANLKEQAKIKKWFLEQLKVLDSQFGPFLHLKN